MAMLTLDRPVSVEFEALRDALAALVKDYPLSVKPLAAPAAAAADAGLLLALDDVPITVLLVNAPIPPSELESALASAITWRDARQRLAGHRAHAIVATLKAYDTHAEVLNAACYVTFVAAALASLANATGVYWVDGQMITEARVFERYAAGLAARHIPVEAWVQLAFLNGGQSADGRQQVAVMTTGLRPFVGREIEFLPTPLPPPVVAQRVLGAARYLIMNGPVIKDGDTLGVSKSERIRVRFAGRGQRPDIPVAQLHVEHISAIS